MTSAYMQGAWITDEPLLLVRYFGVGENIVRNGHLVRNILDGSLVPPYGPLWLGERTLAGLTKADRKALKAAGVTEIRAIPRDVIRGTR